MRGSLAAFVALVALLSSPGALAQVAPGESL